MLDNNITSDLVNLYAEKFSSPEDAISRSLNEYTIRNVHGAQMISGHLQGNFLKMLSLFLQPKNILELGTYTGYATIALATGLEANGKVHTIDIDDSLQPIRDQYWQEAKLSHKIRQHIGSALEIIPTLDDVTFDLAFIDADKGNYINYLDLLLDRMPVNSSIIVDNTLFKGAVCDEATSNKTAIKIHNFNKHLQQLPNVFHVLLPIRDGITLIRKIKD